MIAPFQKNLKITKIKNHSRKIQFCLKWIFLKNYKNERLILSEVTSVQFKWNVNLLISDSSTQHTKTAVILAHGSAQLIRRKWHSQTTPSIKEHGGCGRGGPPQMDAVISRGGRNVVWNLRPSSSLKESAGKLLSDIRALPAKLWFNFRGNPRRHPTLEQRENGSWSLYG